MYVLTSPRGCKNYTLFLEVRVSDAYFKKPKNRGSPMEPLSSGLIRIKVRTLIRTLIRIDPDSNPD